MLMFLILFLKESDMTEEMKTDTMDLCVTSYEKYSTDHEVILLCYSLKSILYKLM